MSLPSKLPTSRERRVDEAIASYLAALDEIGRAHV